MAIPSTGSIFSPGLILQERYRLDEAVAAGGMAEVWRGHDMVLQRQVAIKLLHPHLASDPSVAERFKREAVSAARLSHPHIVPTFDAGSSEGISYIVLGLVAGPTLADVMKGRSLSIEQAVEIARQVADALDHAHRNGLVHRDVKPSNILLVDGGSRVMVADFGIAKAVAETASESMTLPGLIVGTPGYVSPEQIGGHPADARSDIYALGILLHEMICGHTEADQPTELALAATHGVTPDTICSDIPSPLNYIVAKATATDLTNRYAHASAMRDDLARAEAEMWPQNNPAPEPLAAKPGKSVPTMASPQERRSISSATMQQPGITASPETFEQAAIKPIGNWDPSEARKAARHRRFATSIILILLIAAAIGLGLGIKSLGHSKPNHQATTSTTIATVTPAGATSFDPSGSDHVENEGQTKNAVDGDPTTSWSTETYSNSHFGNLKAGVGLIVHVPDSSRLNQIQIDSPSSGWSARIYVADSAPSALDKWGSQIAGQDNIDAGTTTLPLNRAAGNSVLIWITELGTDNRVTITDVRFK